MPLKWGNLLLNVGIFLRGEAVKCLFWPRNAVTVLAPRSASVLHHLPVTENKWGKDFFKIPKLRVCSEFPPLSKGSCSPSQDFKVALCVCRNTSWRSSARQTRRPWIPRSWHGSGRCLSSGGTCAPPSLSQMEFILTNWCSEPSASTTLNSKGKKQGFVVCSLQCATAGVARLWQCLLMWAEILRGCR